MSWLIIKLARDRCFLDVVSCVTYLVRDPRVSVDVQVADNIVMSIASQVSMTMGDKKN